ncbi:glucosaminidase domain-containing protein [Salinimicrobium sp. TH3]|uniref:glucosaminidase domain-containing protein n=1 Tax=Salinimicrobium sp. TH3 TaxID=2997342 RepID=UPI002275BD55|nr:glucosaminidase domain-containing protein [Salinimicrobium sp. TH3]MCY2685910.1 glucosaminidase domain-containing protein [Salinimicrobium sp. TH3]
MKVAFKIFTLVLLTFTVSCGTSKKASKGGEVTSKEHRTNGERPAGRLPAPTPGTYQDKVARYIELYAPMAQEEMELYKIPASITLAQGILESGAGEGELTRRANNHFGIKCHGWTGGKVYHDDDRSQECFRKYKDPKYSFRDHSLFLAERKRYAALFELDPYDYKGWAHGLRAAGYATDRRYPEKLISIIERYQLHLYDGDTPARQVVVYTESTTSGNSGGRAYTVQQGDTLYSIAKRHNLSVEQLQKINNLKGTNIGIGQTLLVTP